MEQGDKDFRMAFGVMLLLVGLALLASLLA